MAKRKREKPAEPDTESIATAEDETLAPDNCLHPRETTKGDWRACAGCGEILGPL